MYGYICKSVWITNSYISFCNRFNFELGLYLVCFSMLNCVWFFFKFKERVSGILISIKLQTIEKSMFDSSRHVSSIKYNVYCNFLRLSRKRNYRVSPKYAFNFDRNIESIREVTFLTSLYVNARHFNCVFNKGFWPIIN